MVTEQHSVVFSRMQHSLIRYFDRVIGVTLTVRTWSLAARLPIKFTAQHQFLLSRLQGREVLFVLSRFELEGYEIRQHAEKVHSIFAGIIIYILPGGTTKLRNELIAMKIPFVIPGYQMYLPWFFIDLREAANKRGEVYLKRKETISPAAQALALKLIKLGGDVPLATAQICQWTGFSKMTVSKAMRELAVFPCVTTKSEGRSNTISLVGNRKNAWHQLIDVLRNPVSKTYFIQTPLTERLSDRFVAGEQALAAISMLGAPELDTYACSKATWALLSRHCAWSDSPAKFKNNDLSYCRIEVWAYDPALLSEQGMVDVLSLYLSLRSDPDERIQGELDSVLALTEN